MSPVEDRALVVDLLSEAVDDLARTPPDAFAVAARRCALLFVHHLIEDGHDPVFKLAVVVVRDEEVADAVQAPPAESCAVVVEFAVRGEERRTEALDQVFLDPTCGGDETVDVVVLDEEADHFAESGRDEVRGVAEEDGAARLGADGRVEFLGLRVWIDRFVREAPSSLRRIWDGQSKELSSGSISSYGGRLQGGTQVRTIFSMRCIARASPLAWNPMRS